MSSENKQIIYSAYLGTSLTTVYTVPANTSTLIMKAKLTCTSGNKTATVCIVPFGGTASTANAHILNQPIGNNETYLCPELPAVVMKAGDFISASASAVTSVALSISAREESVA